MWNVPKILSKETLTYTKDAPTLTQKAAPPALSPPHVRTCAQEVYCSIFQNGKHKEKDKNQTKSRKEQKRRKEMNYFQSLKNKRIITTPRGISPQSCQTLGNPMDCNPLTGSTVHGTFQDTGGLAECDLRTVFQPLVEAQTQTAVGEERHPCSSLQTFTSRTQARLHSPWVTNRCVSLQTPLGWPEYKIFSRCSVVTRRTREVTISVTLKGVFFCMFLFS